MANYDQFAAAVKELSGGKNVVLLDDMDLPSVYVPIYKMKNSDLISGGTENVHPAFRVNMAEKDLFYYSKYQNVIINGRAYSLAHRDPANLINFDAARKACEAKGSGFHLSTLQEWAAIALWCRKNNTMPRGNNNYGADYSAPHEKGQPSFIYEDQEVKKIGRTFTGSGPSTWGHDWTMFGIQDLNGNVCEWNGGARCVNGELQIIVDNNAAMGAECDQSAQSTLWKAIEKTGNIVEPGSKDTLKYDWIENKIQLTTEMTGDKTNTGHGNTYQTMTLKSGFVVPEIAKVLLFYPDDTSFDYGGDWHYFNPTDERMPLCGGTWYDTTRAGVFHVNLDYLRSDVSTYIGFRSAFVSL